MSKRILILGGYGVFGGLLARRLISDARHTIVIAGRSFAKAQNFSRQFGGEAARLDRGSATFASDFAALKPALVIDAAGPFQRYQGDRAFAVVQAALDCGAHYLDLSDDAAFTLGLAQFDDAAKARGLVMLSGASTVPAISSCVVDALAVNFETIDLVETTILPGAKAPRGRSVVKAVLDQTGEALKVFRGGRFTEVAGWSDAQRRDLYVEGEAPILRRNASRIGAPDLLLFPERYQARSVILRAGLEPGLLQSGLSAFGALRGARMLPPLGPFAMPLRWLAKQIEPFGTDRGGMLVRVIGRDRDAGRIEKTWTLIVNGGDGPHIPAVAPYLMANKILAGDGAPGARACLGAFSTSELADGLAPLLARTDDGEYDAPVLFERLLGAKYRDLPPALRALHDVTDQRVWQGTAHIERGRSWISSLIAFCFGFPMSVNEAKTEVVFDETPRGETWTRTMDGRRFRSHLGLSKRLGALTERFGPFVFDIDLQTSSEGLSFPVTGGRCLGVPIPKALLPAVEAREFVNEQGEPCFDVRVSAPLAGLVVHYKGRLTPLSPAAARPDAALPVAAE